MRNLLVPRDPEGDEEVEIRLISVEVSMAYRWYSKEKKEEEEAYECWDVDGEGAWIIGATP